MSIVTELDRCAMTPISTSKSLFLLMGICLWLLAYSHDSKRDNPLDPELTPAVELQVALDDTAGTATLNWTPYEGETPFSAYWVLRKVSGLESVDTLAVINDMSTTTFVDTALSLQTSYSYRVSTVNDAGFEAASLTETIRDLSPPPIEIRFAHRHGDVELDKVRRGRFLVVSRHPHQRIRHANRR